MLHFYGSIGLVTRFLIYLLFDLLGYWHLLELHVLAELTQIVDVLDLPPELYTEKENKTKQDD